MTASKILKLREEAKQWAKDNPNLGLMGPFISRSCWNCNSAHEHLKTVDYPIECFGCGHTYFKGERLTEEGDG